LADKIVHSRVTRWHIFRPKILICVNFGGTCNVRCWYILWPFGLFYVDMVNFVAIFYILGCIFPPSWYAAPRKIWQPWSTPCHLCMFVAGDRCLKRSFVVKMLFRPIFEIPPMQCNAMHGGRVLTRQKLSDLVIEQLGKNFLRF
jgi:hypothetical protein